MPGRKVTARPPAPHSGVAVTLAGAGTQLHHPRHSPTRLSRGCYRCPPIKQPAPAPLTRPLARRGHREVAGLGPPDLRLAQQHPSVELRQPPGVGAWGGTRAGAHAWTHVWVCKGGCLGVQTPGMGARPGREHRHAWTQGARTWACAHVHMETRMHMLAGRPTSAQPCTEAREGTDRRTAVH